MESKLQNVVVLRDEKWLNELVLLTYITHHLLDLNVKLRGKSQIVNKLFQHISAFEKKLKLLEFELSRAALIRLQNKR